MNMIVKNDDQCVSWKTPELLGIAVILTESFYSGDIDYLIRGLLCKSYNKVLSFVYETMTLRIEDTLLQIS